MIASAFADNIGIAFLGVLIGVAIVLLAQYRR